jgi:hypothetical protein
VFLQLILHIFPTSDFRHPVTSPAAVFMAEVLGCSKVGSLRDICNGLFICELVTQVGQSSEINYLEAQFLFIFSIRLCRTDFYQRPSGFCPTLSLLLLRMNPILDSGKQIFFIISHLIMQYFFSDNLSPSDMKRDQILAAALKILHAMAEQSKPNVPSLPVMLKSAVNSLEDISEHTMKK